MKSHNKHKKFLIQIIKTARNESRKEEIQQHGKLLNYNKIVPSKKLYSRKKTPKNDLI
ncbi:MAG: hypothetical protein LBN23_08605 [Paludibacter sp.]|jgi:hypothetical protein|nr:hypothetical protein [Paludibacter sp.]